jgi:hypothetical protein
MRISPFERKKEKLIALADIGSADAGVALIAVGETTRVITAQRESLPLEERPQETNASLVVQQLSSAGEKALASLAQSAFKGRSIDAICAIVGAPWARTFSARATSVFQEETAITAAMISALAQQALADQKDIDRANLLEASVVRVLLNGYPTGKPAGKRAHELGIFALVSDCDVAVRKGANEALARLFPEAPTTWHSGARSVLSVVKEGEHIDAYVVVKVSGEATDIVVVRKGVLSESASVPIGLRSILSSFAKEKPLEETLALLDMLETDQCEGSACDALKTAIAKAEPDLARQFGETMAKLGAPRRLPNDLLLIAPAHFLPWLSRFFSRIDFAPFTATTQPFSVRTPSLPKLTALSGDDPGFMIGCALVNIEYRA